MHSGYQARKDSNQPQDSQLQKHENTHSRPEELNNTHGSSDIDGRTGNHPDAGDIKIRVLSGANRYTYRTPEAAAAAVAKLLGVLTVEDPNNPIEYGASILRRSDGRGGFRYAYSHAVTNHFNGRVDSNAWKGLDSVTKGRIVNRIHSHPTSIADSDRRVSYADGRYGQGGFVTDSSGCLYRIDGIYYARVTTQPC